MISHPEVPSNKLKHNKIVLLLKKKKKMTLGTLGHGLSPPQSVPGLTGPASYWWLQPCEAEEPPACFLLRLLRSRLLEVFRSLIFTWS